MELINTFEGVTGNDIPSRLLKEEMVMFLHVMQIHLNPKLF